MINQVTGQLDNMCFLGNRPSDEVTHINDLSPEGVKLQSGYRLCGEVQDTVLHNKAGDTVRATVKCPRGSSAFAVDKQLFFDKPEFILGPGPPQFPRGRFEQGQAEQLGFVHNGEQWYADCDAVCQRNRLVRALGVVALSVWLACLPCTEMVAASHSWGGRELAPTHDPLMRDLV